MSARVSKPFSRVCDALILVSLASCGTSGAGGVTSVSSALYNRVDTNSTTVWAPRMSLSGRLGDSFGIDSAVAMDAWTGASIDVTTAATEAIHEVRKEVTAGAFYEFEDVTIGGGYRYSAENDYWSHGGVGTLTIDMANNNTTLAFASFGSSDTVGRSGDPGFNKPQSSFGGRISLTQVLDTQTVAQISAEMTRVSGYQAGPYRFVGLGGDGACYGSAPECVPEVVPSLRIRSAAVGRVRRALGEHVSFGAEYRFYFDDWGVLSHTIAPDLAVLIGEHGTLRASYRYYTQSEADFYRSRYVGGGESPRYVTRDRELSTLYSNRVALGYLHELHVGKDGSVFVLALKGGVTRYRYLAFVGLERVDALETTLLLSLNFR